MPERKFKIAILTSHVIQYQDSLFKQIAKHPRIDLTVLFCSKDGAEEYWDEDFGLSLKWNIDALTGYKHKFLKNYRLCKTTSLFFHYCNLPVVKEIKRGRFDAILIMCGWNYCTSWLTILTCILRNVPFLLYGDSSFIKNSGIIKEMPKRFIFSKASGFMITGAMNVEYYKYYGADPKLFFAMPWAVDNKKFTKISGIVKQDKDKLRASHNLSCYKVMIAFSGKLIKRKNPIHVLQALELMKNRNKVEVMYIGSGGEKESLADYVRTHNINGVHFLGFINQDEMPKILGISDVFVLPSSFDPRGTVVNEAMACGLPVVISNMVGVYGKGDIVRDGDNGFVHNVGDIPHLAAILDRLAEDKELREKMGRRSLEIISEWSYDEDIEGILKALEAVNNNEIKG